MEHPNQPGQTPGQTPGQPGRNNPNPDQGDVGTDPRRTREEERERENDRGRQPSQPQKRS